MVINNSKYVCHISGDSEREVQLNHLFCYWVFWWETGLYKLTSFAVRSSAILRWTANCGGDKPVKTTGLDFKLAHFYAPNPVAYPAIVFECSANHCEKQTHLVLWFQKLAIGIKTSSQFILGGLFVDLGLTGNFVSTQLGMLSIVLKSTMECFRKNQLIYWVLMLYR